MKVLDFSRHSIEIKHNWLPEDQDFNLKEHFSFRAYLDYKNSQVTIVGLDKDQRETSFCKLYTEFYREDLRVQPVWSLIVWLEEIHSYLNRHNLHSYKILCKVDCVPGLFPHLKEGYKFDLDKYTFELLKDKDNLYSKERRKCPDKKPLIVPDAMGFQKLSTSICA